jgi:hypothetical protein
MLQYETTTLTTTINNLLWWKENFIQRFRGEPERRKQLEKPKRRWEDNIKINL